MFFFFFNDTATTEIYTLSLHDALPIWWTSIPPRWPPERSTTTSGSSWTGRRPKRSEEHTSELQSRLHLVCRLLLEKKKTNQAGDRREAPFRNTGLSTRSEDQHTKRVPD